jgi:hypothetical protein
MPINLSSENPRASQQAQSKDFDGKLEIYHIIANLFRKSVNDSQDIITRSLVIQKSVLQKSLDVMLTHGPMICCCMAIGT